MTRSSCLALPLAALLLGGCDLTGSSKEAPPPKPLSHFQFVHKANHICAVGNRQMKGLRRPTNPAMLVHNLNVAIRSIEQGIFALRQLAPPPSDAAPFRRIIAGLDTADRLEHRLIDAVNTRQLGHVRTLARRLEILNKQLNRRAKNLGLRICAKD